VDVVGETTAHYLTFDRDSMNAYGSYARMKPPFRRRSQVEALKRAYRVGLLFYTGSDHAPFTPEEKSRGESIWEAPYGLAGLEMTLPLLLELVRQGELTPEVLARNTAQNAAERFGLSKKGRLSIGYDADLAVVESLATPVPFSRTQLHSKHIESGQIYESTRFSTRIAMTVLRGRVIYEGGTLSTKPGSGRIILSGGKL
jgi:dihydroorotase-like cyclic amidohydrolase